MKHSILTTLALCAILILAGCGGEVNLLDDSKLSDTSLLSGEPCAAPCWNGITPGETSFRDAKLIIESDTRYTIRDEQEADENSPARGFFFSEGDNPACCQILSRNGEIVNSFLLQTAPIMSYGDVYDTLGEPAYLAAEKVNDEQGYVALVHPDVPMLVYAFVDNPLTGDISVANKIIGLLYLDETEAKTMLNCAYLYVWRGFKPFSEYVENDIDFEGDGVGDEVQCPTR